MKEKGPIEKEDPNAVRKKLSPKSMVQIEKRASEEGMKGNNGYRTIALAHGAIIVLVSTKYSFPCKFESIEEE